MKLWLGVELVYQCNRYSKAGKRLINSLQSMCDSMSEIQNQYSKKNRKSSLILVLFILLIGNCSSTYAQRVPQKIDSLLRIAPSVDDTTRILNYLKIAEYLEDSTLVKGLNYSSLAYRESVRIKWVDGLKKSLLSNAKYFLMYENHKQALECYKTALQIANVTLDQNYKADVMLALGTYYLNINDVPNAIKCFQDALDLSKGCKDYYNQAMALYYTSLIYQKIGEYKKAYCYVNQSVNFARASGSPEVLCYSWAAFAQYYSQVNDSVNVIQCANNVLKIGRESKQCIGEAFAYMIFADFYGFKRNDEYAIIYYNKAIEIYKIMSVPMATAGLYTKLAQINSRKKQYKAALEYNKKALAIRITGERTPLVASSYINIGDSYMNLGDYKKSEEYLLKGLKLSETSGNLKYTIYNYSKLYELNKKKKDYKKALDYYTQYVYYNDSLNKINDLKKIKDIQSDYEVLKREKLLQAQTYKLTKSKQSMLLLVLFVIILVLTLLVLFFFYRNNKRFSEQLEVNVKARTVELEHEVEMRKLIESELVNAKEVAEKSNEAKNRFLATTSHEIRTPLNGILGFSNLLLNDELNEQHREFIQIIHDSAGHLFDLIREIIDFSKIERGEIAFISDSFNLHEVIHSVEKVTKISHQDRKPDFYVKIEENVPEYLKGDESRLRQVLFNLINNAFKFTEEGFVSLEVRSIESGLSKERIQFVVRDTGIGIVETEIENIFKDFVQLNTDVNSTRKGMGLGLSICKQIVEGQKGEIRVDSKPGSGSRFIIELTFERVQGSLQKNDLLNLEDLTSSSIRILYAEDKLVNAMVLKRYLMLQGVKVDIAENGKVAIEMLQRENYDLILMDIEMPVMDGYEATKVIRELSDEKKRNIPVIALTAHALDEFEQKSYESGMNAFQTKPLQIESLMKVIRTFVAR
jgi:signal transduction histidine kinase